MTNLTLFAFAFLKAASPGMEKDVNAQEVVRASVAVVSNDANPVFGSSVKELSVMLYYALKESWLVIHAVGDGGKSFGVWQQQSEDGKADIDTQARSWLFKLHYNATQQPNHPTWPFHGMIQKSKLAADNRVAKAFQLAELIESN
jgi:hypothetical protein